MFNIYFISICFYSILLEKKELQTTYRVLKQVQNKHKGLKLVN